jgi:hypothetical protein
MRKTTYALLVSIILASATTSLAQAAVYDATADFSVTNGNPNGVWSYGWMNSDFSGSFNAYTNTVNTLWAQWYTAGMSSDNTPAVAYNGTSSLQYGVAPGQLTLHPGPQTQASVLRFTAPTSGIYNISGQFFPGDSGSMSVGVRQGSTWLWQRSDSGSFSINNYTLTSGSAIDFVVYGGYYSGNTPLSLTISSSVPEPSAILLLGAGLASLAIVRKRKA